MEYKMKNGLTMIERLVVESLVKKERNIQELELDTKLSHGILMNVLLELLMNGVIRYQKGLYSLEKENSFQWLNKVNQKENLKAETKEVANSLIDRYFAENNKVATELKVKKVWLTKEEEIVLNSHLINLESFFNQVKNARKLRPQKENTAEQRVILWGTSHYSELVEGILEAI